jgi:prepilin-type processing-associated H-X9-DG protein
MSEDNHDGASSPWMAILMGIGVVVLLAAMLLPALGPVNQGRPVLKCKIHLKQIGAMIDSYYSAGTVMTLPMVRDPHITADFGGIGFDANLLTCPSPPYDQPRHYLWNLKANGGQWKDWNNQHSPLAWDASPHKINDKINVLFGDGHVEEMTPEELATKTK